MAFLVVPLFSSVYCYLKNPNKYRRFEKQSNLDSVMNKTSEMLNSFQDTFCDQSASLYPDGFFFVCGCVCGGSSPSPATKQLTLKISIVALS